MSKYILKQRDKVKIIIVWFIADRNLLLSGLWAPLYGAEASNKDERAVDRASSATASDSSSSDEQKMVRSQFGFLLTSKMR